jgi:hypothetical protein
MRMRLAAWARRPWLPALVLLLAACAPSQNNARQAATLTVAPPAVASATTVLSTMATALTQAPPTPAPPTAIPTTFPPSDSTPAATLAPAGPTATGTPDPAITAVLAYLDARARADVTAVTSLSCKTWKPKAVTEAVSFRSMNAKLVGVTCQVNGSAGAFTLVGCGGKMVTTYGGESRDWDLSAFVYQVTAEDGQWKMCGYH